MSKHLLLLGLAFILSSCSPLTTEEAQLQVMIESRYSEDILSEDFNEEIPIIGLISKYDGDPFLDGIMNSAAEVLEANGYHTIIKSPYSYSNTVSEQKKIMDEFTISGVDGIILIPNDAIELNSYIEEALKRGIPIVIPDTPIDMNDIRERFPSMETISFVQISNYKAANNAATRFFAETDQKFKCFLMNGDLSNPNAVERRSGIVDAIDRNETVTLEGEDDGGWQEHLAYEIIINRYSSGQFYNLIMCANDRMAIGVTLALKDLNLLDKVTVTGFDGIDDALIAVEEGHLAYTVMQIPEDFGHKSAEVMMKFHKMDSEKTKVDLINIVETKIITKGQ